VNPGLIDLQLAQFVGKRVRFTTGKRKYVGERWSIWAEYPSAYAS
jgi:hypothetical protein